MVNDDGYSDIVYAMSFDINDVQCGRIMRVSVPQMGNLTARRKGSFYIVERRGDPLIHVPGRSSSRTSCNYSVTESDLVFESDRFAVTCVTCMAAVMANPRFFR